MPNWCENSLTIHADTEDKESMGQLKELVEKAKNKGDEDTEKNPFSMDKFIPRPSGEDSNWYDWNCAKWGTKWDTCETFVEDVNLKHGFIKYAFMTAWAPPEPFIKSIGNMYPKLEFFLKYEEPGMGYMGVLRVVDGEVTVEKYMNYYES